jgi:hypothetical protein
MKMRMLAVSTAVMLCAASTGAFAQASTTASPAVTAPPAGSSMLCSDFIKLSADAQDAFLKGYQLGIQQNAGVSGEMTGAIGSSTAPAADANAAAPAVTDNSTNMAANSSTSTPAAGTTAAAGNANPMFPDVASLTSSCSGNDSNPISQYLSGSSSVSQ